MSEWYYAIDGQQHGPVSNRELHDLAGSGGLQPTDLVWQDGFADWKPASEVAGLFPAHGSTPTPPPPPTMGGSNPFAETFVSPGSNGPSHRTPDILKIPLLISGISCCVVGVLWTLTCFGAILGIPLAVLAYYELKLYRKADLIPLRQFAGEAKNLSVYQIIAGAVTGNIPTLVCGILLMVKSGEIELKEYTGVSQAVETF